MMQGRQTIPSFRWSTLLLAGLSLSIGWGIRGNFGHEYGAAFAGCLAAIAVCLTSGREDWRRRVVYFAFFGALGWGFGGSISYMQVISYTHSGHAPSQLYGFVGLFYIGFLWAALGGAGTALPAVADRDRLTRFFQPLLFVFGAWVVLGIVLGPLAEFLAPRTEFDTSARRHESPLYWFDADYLQAFFALAGLCVYDLWERRSLNVLLAPVFGVFGALIGLGVQAALKVARLDRVLANALTYPLGDPSAINPETGKLFDPNNFLDNWPQWFSDYPEHLGWFIGLLMGIAAYFLIFGRFRNGASLFVYMAVGWIACFLIFPVFGSLFFTDIGGLRMTPPRADDWAGITGVFLGMSIWMLRNRMPQVAFASVVSGFIGGFGFSGMQWLKLMMIAPGSPGALRAHGLAPETAEFAALVARWANWRGQNWHSFLEQSYGFVNGIAVAVAIGLIASRVKVHEEDAAPSSGGAERRWTAAFAGFFVLLGLTYLNLFKNVRTWVEQLGPPNWQRVVEQPDGTTKLLPALWDVPILGRLPGVEALEMTPSGWFRLTWLLFVVAFIILARRHLRRGLAIVPRSSLGKGQLVYLILLWAMVIGNLERALPGFTEGRLLTEWVIFANAVIATVMVLVCPDERDSVRVSGPSSFWGLYGKAWAAGIVSMAALVALFWGSSRWVYGDEHSGHAGLQRRFGPEATWRIEPNLKNEEHR